MRIPIYLDHNATTPVDPRVLDAMLPYFQQQFGNPASKTHRFGWDADRAVGEARDQIASAIGARGREIVFTSGATEANNLAILGVAARFHGPPGEIVTAATEHKAVLDPCRALERQGWKIHCLIPDSTGLLDPAQVERALSPRTALVSVMAANNETGTLAPLAEIGALTRARGIPFHCDAAQAIGKIALDVSRLNIDLLSISGHKVYASKGIGALFVRSRPRVPIAPIQYGGGHEGGLRSGTVPTPLVVGLGVALELAEKERETEMARQRALTDRLWRAIHERIPSAILHGVDRLTEGAQTLPGTINVGFPGIEAEALLLGVPELALSSGSACTSAEIEPSHVLRAMGVPASIAHGSIRCGVGRSTRPEEIDYAARRISAVVERLLANATPS